MRYKQITVRTSKAANRLNAEVQKGYKLAALMRQFITTDYSECGREERYSCCQFLLVSIDGAKPAKVKGNKGDPHGYIHARIRDGVNLHYAETLVEYGLSCDLPTALAQLRFLTPKTLTEKVQIYPPCGHEGCGWEGAPARLQEKYSDGFVCRTCRNECDDFEEAVYPLSECKKVISFVATKDTAHGNA